MDWIHCNKCCYTKASGGNIPLYCGSCCHVICKNCLQTKCPVCQKQFNYTQLTDKGLPQQQTSSNVVLSYFEDLVQSRQNLQKRCKFQYEQRARLENQQIKVFNVIKKDKNETIQLKKIEYLSKAAIKEDLIKIKEYKNIIKKFKRGSLNLSSSSSKHTYSRISANSFNFAPSARNNSKQTANDSGVFSNWL